MLDTLRLLGSHGDLLDALIKYPSVPERGREKYVVRVIFDLDEKEVTVDRIRYQQELARVYAFVGNTFAAAREKVARLTTDKVEYLAERADDNLISNTRAKIKQIRQNTLSNDRIDELDKILAEIETEFIKGGRHQTVQERISAYSKDAVLYTVCVKRGGELTQLARHEGYRDLLQIMLKFPGNLTEGTCHLCGLRKQVLSDPSFPSGSLLKVWSKDKRGFMAGISDSDEARVRSFAICADCRESLLRGWGYVRRNLTVRIENFYAFLLPRLPSTLGPEHLDRVVGEVGKAFGAVVSYQKLLEFDEYVKDLSSPAPYGGWYGLTVIFGNPETAHFRVYGVVQDVPVTNLSRLRQEMARATDEAHALLNGDKKQWSLGFSDIYRLIPLAADRNKTVRDWKPIIELYSSMLSFSPYPRDRLLKSALLLSRIYRFQSFEGYNIRKTNKWDEALCLALIKFNYLLRMLKHMAVIQGDQGIAGEDALQAGSDHVLRKIDEWFKAMGYNGVQQALFLLGYLLGEVGYKQYAKSREKKPILEKIDFNGMRAEKVMLLANQVFKSLMDYRILHNNEKIYYYMKERLDRHINELRASPVENTFYILSGYAFCTYLHITGGAQHG